MARGDGGRLPIVVHLQREHELPRPPGALGTTSFIEELPLVLFACEIALGQQRHGRFFLIENPPGSRLWSLEPMLPMLQILGLPDTWSAILDTGAWGAEIDGQMIAKPMRFVGNLPELDEIIGKRLTPEQRQWCQKVEGTMTRKSQEYPDALVHAILQHLRDQVRRLEPFRFNFKQVYGVAQPTREFEAWKPIFDNIATTSE